MKDPFNITKLCLELAQHFIDQGAIFHHQQVSIENAGIFRADRLGNALLHLEYLHAGLNERRFEAPNFIGNFRRCDTIMHDVIEIVAHDVNHALGDSGGNARTVKPNFLPHVIAVHPLRD